MTQSTAPPTDFSPQQVKELPGQMHIPGTEPAQQPAPLDIGSLDLGGLSLGDPVATAAAEAVPKKRRPGRPRKQADTAASSSAMTGAPPEVPASQASPVSSSRGPLYLDIETIPRWDEQEAFGLPPLPEQKPEDTADTLMPPANFVTQDLKAIAEWFMHRNPPESWLLQVIEQETIVNKKPMRAGLTKLIKECREQKGEAAVAYGERVKLMSVTPELCRIVSIAWAMGDDDPVCEFAETEEHEKAMLGKLWNSFGRYSGPLVVFNGLRFDMPVIFIRSAMLGIAPTRRFSTKPWDGEIVDLYKARFPSADMKLNGISGGQKSLARLYGLEKSVDQDDDGSQVWEHFKVRAFDQIVEHNKKDIVRLRKLHGLYRGFFCN